MTQFDRLLDEDAVIEAYLQGLNEAALRRLVVDAACRDDSLRERLLMAATAAQSQGLAGLRQVVGQATHANGFIEWCDARNYASRLEDLAELLAQRIKDGMPELVDVIEEAISLAEQALQHIDDSDGEVMAAIHGLRQVHLAACNALHPDPEALARRLYDLQMHGPWDTFHEVLPDYAPALGARGLRTYRQRVEEAWEALPSLGPEHRSRDWSTSRFRLESAMKDIASLADDFELQVAVHAKNLSSPSCFLTLARLFHERERNDDALSWATQGLAAFPGERIDDLLSLAIELQIVLGRHAEAEASAWQGFERSAGCESFFELMGRADRIDRKAILRQRAFDHLWQRVAEEERSPEGHARRTPWERPRRGEIVSIFLREGDFEAMWDAFCGGKVAVDLWERVADARATSHPEEAAALYKRLLPHVVESGARGSYYEGAYAIVKKVRALREAQKQLGMFRDELAQIRLEWKRKRNFMKLLDAL